MALRKIKSGWQADGRYKDANGLDHRVRGSGSTRKAALDDLQANIKASKTKLDHNTVRATEGELRMVGELWKHFTERRRYKNLAKKSQLTYSGRWDSFIKWCGQNRFTYIYQVIPSDSKVAVANAEEYYGFLLDSEGYDVATANAKFNLLSGLIDLEMRRPGSTVKVNPFLSVEKDNVAEKEIRFFSHYEQACLWDVMTEWEKHRFGAILHSGMRPGEFSNLTRDQLREISFVAPEGEIKKKRVIAITPHHDWKPKWGKIRYIAINEELEKHLNFWLDEYPSSEYVVGGERPMAHNSLNNDFKVIRDRAIAKYPNLHIEDTTVYALRRTFGSLLAEKGFPMGFIAYQMGHRDERTTRKHYASIRPQVTMDIVDSLNYLDNQYYQEYLKKMDTLDGHRESNLPNLIQNK